MRFTRCWRISRSCAAWITKQFATSSLAVRIVKAESRAMKRGPKVGFAVVGLGAIAQGSVLPAFRHAKQAKLVALVSRDKRKAEKLGRRFEAKACYAAEKFADC